MQIRWKNKNKQNTLSSVGENSGLGSSEERLYIICSCSHRLLLSMEYIFLIRRKGKYTVLVTKIFQFEDRITCTMIVIFPKSDPKFYLRLVKFETPVMDVISCLTTCLVSFSKLWKTIWLIPIGWWSIYKNMWKNYVFKVR